MAKRQSKQQSKKQIQKKLNEFEITLRSEITKDFKLSGKPRLDNSIIDAIIYSMKSGKPEFNPLITKYHKYVCGYCKDVCKHNIDDCKERNKQTMDAAENTKKILQSIDKN